MEGVGVKGYVVLALHIAKGHEGVQERRMDLRGELIVKNAPSKQFYSLTARFIFWAKALGRKLLSNTIAAGKFNSRERFRSLFIFLLSQFCCAH